MTDHPSKDSPGFQVPEHHAAQPRRSGEGLRDALVAHDRRVDARGVRVWVGAEPTFTDRFAETAEWLREALGDDKRVRAEQMLKTLANATPGCAVLHSHGRQYASETAPRWNLGVYARRDGQAVWDGPPDPLLAAPSGAATPAALAKAFAAALRADDATAKVFRADAGLPWRVVWRAYDPSPPPQPAGASDPVVTENETTPFQALSDSLAADGMAMLACGVAAGGGLQVELPAMETVDDFATLLRRLAAAARQLSLATLRIAGRPPPVDDSVAWTTVTPDPAVVEVNVAPARGAADLLDSLRAIESAASHAGLTPYRLHYNGLETDSGGGGQITLGGRSPQASPFLMHAGLLPALIRYLNRHPSLSYYFAPESVGAASQGPRADEGTPESRQELDLALALLDSRPAVDGETLWQSLAPFLADASGNRHRAELNIEKLCNPLLGARGRLGLVEFRALRMPRDAETLASLAALLRGLVAMLVQQPSAGPLLDWGEQLHDRFSLPFYLRQDLCAVLADLEAADVGLPAAAAQRLLADDARRMADVELPGATLQVSRALEFWPLLGDVASQEASGARLVDASTARVEFVLRTLDEHARDKWQLSAMGHELPLHREQDENGPARVSGVRYRTFSPSGGLHPTAPACSPLAVELRHPRHGAFVLTLHDWQPEGGPYSGLPVDLADARMRREARCILAAIGESDEHSVVATADTTLHVLDLRRPLAAAPGVDQKAAADPG